MKNAVVKSLGILSVATVLFIQPVLAAEPTRAPFTETEIKFAPDLDSIIYPDSAWGDTFKALEAFTPKYIPVDSEFTLPIPPANSSPETKAELETLFGYARTLRTPEMMDKIKKDEGSDNRILLGLGLKLAPEMETAAEELHKLATDDMDRFIYKFKREYKRARPTQLATNFTIVIKIPEGPAYPSGYAAVAQMSAHLYSYIDPDNKPKYFEMSQDLSLRREIAGLHYPSDTKAARDLADQVFARLLESPEFKAKLDAAKQMFQTKASNEPLVFTDQMWTRQILEIASLEPKYLDKNEQFTLEPAPANDSEITKQDLAIMHKYQNERRTPEEIEKIKAEAHEWKELSLDPSVNVTPEIREKINRLADEAVTEHGYYSFVQKRLYKRARPTQVDPTLTLVIPVPRHPAYPSGHGGQSHMSARVLSQIDPANKEKYMNLARDIGVRREIAGVHYPSDTKAGIALADQVFEKLMATPAFRAQIDALSSAMQEIQY